MFALLAVAALAWDQQTDEVGGTDQLGEGADAYKLDVYRVGSTDVRLDELDVWLRTLTDTGSLHFVVYQQHGYYSWRLLWDSGAIVPASGDGFKASPDPALKLEAGETYAMGVWFGKDSFVYGYDSSGQSKNLGWGVADAAVWAENGTVSDLPDRIQRGTSSDTRYDQQVTVSIPEDSDGDGFDEWTDCDDQASQAHPGAEEICDDIDDDCDGEIDEGVSLTWYLDADGDGDGDPNSPVTACDPPDGAVQAGTDCDDSDEHVYPRATERCDGKDDDCDGVIPDDEGDSDGDGALDCEDCAPDDPSIAPGHAEPCDGVDHDCDGKAADPQVCLARSEELVATGSECGCDSGATGSGWLLALGLAWGRRRR